MAPDPGSPKFYIVANADPGPKLKSHISSEDWSSDVQVVTPDRPGQDVQGLPPAWPDIQGAIDWCAAIAKTVPFRLTSAETLVWKLAAISQLAGSGTAPYESHRFHTGDLPDLFEQVALQLQEFPDPPISYRPHVDEPALESDHRVRLVVGFGGAGKTSWASQAPLNTGDSVAYTDVGGEVSSKSV